MVVIALIAIISAMTAPHLATFYQNAKLTGTARKVATFVNRARDVALSQRRACQVVWEAERNRLVLLVQRDPVREPAAFDYAEGRFAQLTMPVGISLTTEDAAATTGPSGSEAETTFTLTNPAGDSIRVRLKAGSGRAIILTD